MFWRLFSEFSCDSVSSWLIRWVVWLILECNWSSVFFCVCGLLLESCVILVCIFSVVNGLWSLWVVLEVKCCLWIIIVCVWVNSWFSDLISGCILLGMLVVFSGFFELGLCICSVSVSLFSGVSLWFSSIIMMINIIGSVISYGINCLVIIVSVMFLWYFYFWLIMMWYLLLGEVI